MITLHVAHYISLYWSGGVQVGYTVHITNICFFLGPSRITFCKEIWLSFIWSFLSCRMMSEESSGTHFGTPPVMLARAQSVPNVSHGGKRASPEHSLLPRGRPTPSQHTSSCPGTPFWDLPAVLARAKWVPAYSVRGGKRNPLTPSLLSQGLPIHPPPMLHSAF